MTISSVHASSLSTFNSTSSPSLPLSLSKSTISSELSSILSDHSYTLKPQGDSIMGYNQTIVCEPCDVFDDSNSCGGDTMLNSCSVVYDNVTGEDGDTDFLKDLEDLDFGPGDLDPCCDVEMEDSFQEFIDSALEKSSPDFHYLNVCGDTQDAEIFHKEDFLARLDLRPTEVGFSKDKIWSPSLISVTSGVIFCNTWSDINSSVPASKDTTFCDVIPTKRCSCLLSDCIPKAVYSTADVNHQDCVRICPSTLITKVNNIECKNCTQSSLASERIMSPLFIDTSLSECSQTHQLLSEDHLHVSMDKSKLPEVEKDTADIMKWLKESQHHDDDNNNSLSRRCDNRTFTETSGHGNFDDLESFVDLEDFLTETMDTGVVQHTIFDDNCQRTNEHSEYEKKEVSHLRLSFLEELSEHMLDADQPTRFGSHLDFSCEGFSQDSLTPQSSNMSHCGSPTWSVDNSNQTSSLDSMNFSLSSHSKNTFDDFSLKNQLALLKLFSEENAESLLLTDSTVPNTRFM